MNGILAYQQKILTLKLIGWLVDWLFVLFNGISTLFGSIYAESSHFDRNFVLVWFGFMAYQQL